MLEVKIGHGKGGATACTASGDIFEISADVACVIAGIYSQLMHSDPMIAQFFRYNVRKLVKDPDSPMWDTSTQHEGICIIQSKYSKEET